jgi:hypothetical protein
VGGKAFNGYGIGDNTVGLQCCCKDIAGWKLRVLFWPLGADLSG